LFIEHLHIQLDLIYLAVEYIIIFFIFTQHQLAGADGILFPALRQYPAVIGNSNSQQSDIANSK
jgi:hypothetical protein